MKKYTYHINNLTCPNCAKKIENELTKKYNNVILNFNTLKLTILSDKEINIKNINDLIREIEPDIYLTETQTNNDNTLKEVFVLLLGLVIGIIGSCINNLSVLKNILLITSYIILLHKVFIKAIKLLLNNHTIDENLLITISCIGAYLVNEPTEGIMVITLYSIGKILENKAVNNSRNSIKELLSLKQDYAYLKKDNEIIKIKNEDIKINDILVVKKGENIPVDSVVIKGKTYLDTSSITGESDLKEVNINDEVLSGYINTDSVIEVKATHTFEDSLISEILRLTEIATDKKTKTENMVSKISKIYTPTVLILAIIVALFLPLITSLTYSESIYRALTFLVISCPCAIAISVPLSYFIAIGTSSKNGILIKGSNYLDNLSKIKKIIFDKTGTLTNGTYTITNIDITDKKYSKKEIIEILIKGESLSNHPIAKSILKLSNKKIKNSDITNFKELTGKGITYKLNDKKIKVGNQSLCKCDINSDLHLNINNKHVASITINDGIKDNAYEVIKNLKQNNIKTYIFTGDKKEVAISIGKSLQIDKIKYEMLPTDKYYYYEKVKENDITAFVGDGINDSVVLKRSDIGISMGATGSKAAIEASDIVIMNDDLSKILLAINISKYTRYIIKQNLIGAISVKILILLLSIFGLANMWLAVFADTGLTLLTIINTLRITKKFPVRKK